MIKQTELRFDLQKLLGDLEFIRSKYDFDPLSRQIGLTHRPTAAKGWPRIKDAVGSLWDEKSGSFIAEEKDFSTFNEEFKGLYLHSVYEELKKWSPLGIGRVRFMLRQPHTCYSMHTDVDVRYHITLTTNENCLTFFKHGQSYHIPADGSLYEFNAFKPHTAFNAGRTDRIHLVFGTYVK